MKKGFYKTAATAGVGFYTLLFVLPLLFMLRFCSIDSLKQIATSYYYRKIIGFTVLQAALSAILSIIAGIPLACIMSTKKIRTKKILDCIFYLPFVLPSILVVLGFVIFYGNNGYLNNLIRFITDGKSNGFSILYSFKAVIMAHAFYNIPVAAKLIENAICSIDYSLIEASECDGISKIRAFSKIIFPMIIPSVFSSFCLIFLYCFSSFAIILVLGGGPALTTIEVEIYRLAKISLDFEGACTLSLLSMIATLLILTVNNIFENRTIVQESFLQSHLKKNLSFIDIVYLIITALFTVLPILSIVVRSFFSSSTRSSEKVFSLDAYRGLLNISQGLINTFTIAIISSVIGTLIALLMCFFICNGKNSKFKEAFSMLPLAVSSVVIGLAYVVTGRYFSAIPAFIRIVFAHSIITMPFALKTILPAYRAIPKSITEAAVTDGCSDYICTTKIHIPLIGKSIKTSVMFCFVLSCGEFNCTSIMGNGIIKTIPTMIYSMVTSYNYQGACALGTIILALCVAVYFVKTKNQDY